MGDEWTEREAEKLGLGFKEKLALWVLWRWLKGKDVNFNFKNYGIVDWAKLVGNVALAFGAGYAQGSYAGGAVAAMVALTALLQTPPAHESFPK